MGQGRIISLKWDTEHFGIPCGRVQLTEREDAASIQALYDESSAYRFISLSNPNCNASNSRLLAEHTNAFVADTNIQLYKAGLTPSASLLDVENRVPYRDGVIELARTAFRHSRFLADPQLAICGGDTVYAEWVKNAFTQDEKYFALAKEENRTMGFVLFHFEEKAAVIELIAVAHSGQGRGTGKALWNAVETAAVKKGLNIVRVGTQVTNQQALNFYIKMGCRIGSVSQIYHMWRQD